MDLDRRFIFAGLAALPALVGGGAEACTITGVRKTPRATSRIHRTELDRFVQFLNESYGKPAEEVTSNFLQTFQVEPPPAGFSDLMNRPNPEWKNWTPRPVRLIEMNLVRRLNAAASYQFTLRRFTIVPAEPDNDCIPGFPETYGEADSSFIATFIGKGLNTVRKFPEWFIKSHDTYVV